VTLNKQRVFILLGILLLLTAGAAYVFFQNNIATRSMLPEGLTTATIKRGTISNRVGSTGKARPNQLVPLSWETSGTIGKVNVKNLDRVKAGDVLVELDHDSLNPSILQAMEDLPAAQRELDNLHISDVKRTQAKENLAKAQIEYKNAKDTREIKNQRNATDTNLEAAQATYLQAKSNLKSLEDFFAFLQDKPEDDITRAQVTAQLSRARKNYDWALWNYQWAQSKPLPEDVRIAEANLKVAESKLADAQREWEKVKNNPDPDDITSAQSKVESLQSKIGQAMIVAPIDGKVVDSRLLVGDTVSTGRTALTIMDSSQMFLDISVSEIDINKVKFGKEVNFSFDAIPEKSYVGTVTEISTVGVSDQEVIYYTVSCEISNPDASIKPGMTAAVSITIDNVRNVISLPSSALHISGKQYFVYLVRNNAIKQIPVELGLISDSFSELKSGDVQEGDIVVTNPQLVETPESGK
jgi:HlyD family secretion protein